MLPFRGDKKGFTTDVVVLAISIVVFAILILVFFFLFKIEEDGLVSGSANKVSFNDLYAKTALLNILRMPIDDSRVDSVEKLEDPFFSYMKHTSLPVGWYENKTVGQFILFMGDKIKTKKDLDNYKSGMRWVLLSTLYDSDALIKCEGATFGCAKDSRPKYCFSFEVIRGNETLGPVNFHVNKYYADSCEKASAEFVNSLVNGGFVLIKMFGYKP